MTFLLNQVWGRVVKVGGLMGRPDLLFVFDADEIEKVDSCENLLQMNIFRPSAFRVEKKDRRMFVFDSFLTRFTFYTFSVLQKRRANTVSAIYAKVNYQKLQQINEELKIKISSAAWLNTRANCAKTSSEIYQVLSVYTARSGRNFDREYRSLFYNCQQSEDT